MTATLGILVLDTRFPRLPGDAGQPATWPFPVLLETLVDVGPEQAVRAAPRTPALLDTLAAAVGHLAARGADGVATTCGFLALFQRELAARSAIPVATSSLLQVPLLERLLPAGRRVGILTAEAASLTATHLQAVGVPTDQPVEGVASGGAFAATFLGNSRTLDRAAVESEVVAAGERLCARYPDIGAIVLECANLPPYAAALHRALRLPVYGTYEFLCWFQAGLRPRRFAAEVG